MAIKMLIFDYRETEYDFFGKNKFDNYEIKFFDFSLNEDTICQISEEDKQNTIIISTFINSELTPKVINSFKNLRAIATRSTGYDYINQKACNQRNIAILNVQNYGETSVAEFTMGLILGMSRKIFNAIDDIKNHQIYKKSYVGKDLENMTLGIVGTGAIGAAVCKLAYSFGMNILAYDVVQKLELQEKYKVNFTTLDNLLRNSDIVTLHIPYTGNNYHMFSKHEFNIMKKDSIFVNVARGEVVELKYLKEQLENGKITAAALDVVACVTEECEEFSKKLEKTSLSCFENSSLIKELVSMPNVFITPHIAYESQDAINYILTKTFEGIKDFINGGNKNRVC